MGEGQKEDVSESGVPLFTALACASYMIWMNRAECDPTPPPSPLTTRDDSFQQARSLHVPLPGSQYAAPLPILGCCPSPEADAAGGDRSARAVEVRWKCGLWWCQCGKCGSFGEFDACLHGPPGCSPLTDGKQ